MTFRQQCVRTPQKTCSYIYRFYLTKSTTFTCGGCSRFARRDFALVERRNHRVLSLQARRDKAQSCTGNWVVVSCQFLWSLGTTFHFPSLPSAAPFPYLSLLYLSFLRSFSQFPLLLRRFCSLPKTYSSSSSAALTALCHSILMIVCICVCVSGRHCQSVFMCVPP